MDQRFDPLLYAVPMPEGGRYRGSDEVATALLPPTNVVWRIWSIQVPYPTGMPALVRSKTHLRRTVLLVDSSRVVYEFLDMKCNITNFYNFSVHFPVDFYQCRCTISCADRHMGIQILLTLTALIYSGVVIQFLHTVFGRIVLLPTIDNAEGFESQLSLPANGFVGERTGLRPNFSSEVAPSVPSRRLTEFYEAQAIERRWSLARIIQRNPDFYHRLYNNLVPEVHCPELVRVGSTNSGGRWICSPFRIPQRCTILSLGLLNEVTFERELQYITDYRCQIFAFDAEPQKRSTMRILEGIQAKVKHAQVKEDTDVSRNQYTLMDLMRLEGVSDVDVLKIGIEGSVLVTSDFLRYHKPAQILIETRGTPLETFKQLNYISRHGYWLYSYEINGNSHSRACYSFVHQDAFRQYGVTKLAKILDPSQPVSS
ncbi:hypothetical protein Y032_0418g1115 [Ancylostoma ceylanicum]|uniref:Methyltransferase domain-containing protein n=1 Tax=Ancylostoma ceylanicum TaxID=53326 RepID=A0A016X399_9BILA|nr:hypothetical protein Y032_0418g1115 [Ancylostoma ceylanicum]